MYTPFSSMINRKLGIILIAIGILLLPDFVTLGFTPGADILNFMIAMPLSEALETSYDIALYYTFIFAFVMVGIGLLIYPYNTKRMIIGRLNIAKDWIITNPLIFIGAMLLFYVIWTFMNAWNDVIYEYAKAYVLGVI